MCKKHRAFLITFILLVSGLGGQTPYQFFFKISGGARGHILLIFPYRFYYEISAVVHFTATQRDNGSMDFSYSDLPEAGYMMRTIGFSGRSIIILTAHYDKNRHLPAANQIFDEFRDEVIEYSQRVKRVFKHPFNVVFARNHGYGFTRSADGIHHDVYDYIDLKYIGGAKKFKVYFNVYKIMAALLQIYNHSYLPGGGRQELRDIISRGIEDAKKINWSSTSINLSPELNVIADKASRMAERYANLRQETDFQLKYSVSSIADDFIEVTGEARPMAIISGDLAITIFSRKVGLTKDKLQLLEDSIFVEILTPGGKGGRATLSLIKSNSNSQ